MKLRMACWELCEIISNPQINPHPTKAWKWKKKNLKRAHLHCTTCPIRRVYYNKGDARKKFLYIPPNQSFMLTTPVDPTSMPNYHRLYSMLVNVDCWWYPLKRIVLRALRILENRIATAGYVLKFPKPVFIPFISVTPHIVPYNHITYYTCIREDVPFWKLKQFFIRSLRSIQEVIANW